MSGFPTGSIEEFLTFISTTFIFWLTMRLLIEVVFLMT